MNPLRCMNPLTISTRYFNEPRRAGPMERLSAKQPTRFEGRPIVISPVSKDVKNYVAFCIRRRPFFAAGWACSPHIGKVGEGASITGRRPIDGEVAGGGKDKFEGWTSDPRDRRTWALYLPPVNHVSVAPIPPSPLVGQGLGRGGRIAARCPRPAGMTSSRAGLSTPGVGSLSRAGLSPGGRGLGRGGRSAAGCPRPEHIPRRFSLPSGGLKGGGAASGRPPLPGPPPRWGEAIHYGWVSKELIWETVLTVSDSGH